MPTIVSRNAVHNDATAPLEIVRIIIEHAIPSTLSSPALPAYLPILFPRNPKVTKTATYNITVAHSVLADLASPLSWRYLVLTKPAHISNITPAADTNETKLCYRSTLRCDIHVPYGSPTNDMDRFFHSFPNLQTIVWEFPHLKFFSLWRNSPCPTVNFLQIGTLPLDFGGRHVAALARIFPNLWSLQIADAPSVLDTPFETSTLSLPLLPQLTVLAVGSPWNFNPSRPYHDNQFLSLVESFPQGCLWPSLIDLKIEHYVDVSNVFFERHAQNIHTLTFGSNNEEFFQDPLIYDSCRNLSTLVIQLNPDSLDYPELPSTVSRIVILQPFLPPWRSIAHHKQHLRQCLDCVYDIPTTFVSEVLCEGRRILDSESHEQETIRFANRNIRFSTIEFGELSSGYVRLPLILAPN